MGTDMGEFAIKIRVTLMDEITEDKGKYQHPTVLGDHVKPDLSTWKMLSH